MIRYIDADLLKDKTTRVNNIWNVTTNAEGKGLDEIIDDIPTADVVEVVRCKDCKYYNTYENHEKINDGDKLYDGWCMRWSGIEDMNDNDFCSYGERAEA